MCVCVSPHRLLLTFFLVGIPSNFVSVTFSSSLASTFMPLCLFSFLLYVYYNGGGGDSWAALIQEDMCW